MVQAHTEESAFSDIGYGDINTDVDPEKLATLRKNRPPLQEAESSERGPKAVSDRNVYFGGRLLSVDRKMTERSETALVSSLIFLREIRYSIPFLAEMLIKYDAGIGKQPSAKVSFVAPPRIDPL